MDSDKIRDIVEAARALTRGERSPEEIMDSMTREMGRSPNLAAGITEHLRSRGLDLMTLDGEAAERFRTKFKARFEALDERAMSHIKRITDRWFTDQTSSS